MPEEEEVWYVCMRVKDLPKPYVPCLKGKCKICDSEVFYSKYVYEQDANVRRLIDQGKLLCVQCVKKAVAKKEPVNIIDSKSVEKEVKDYFKGEAS